jgi:hypothetical protein
MSKGNGTGARGAAAGRRAFTLLEVLMAFGAGSMLLGIIYFFHFGLVKTWSKTTDKLDLTTVAEVGLETLTRDLRMTHHVSEIKPDRILISKLPAQAVENQESFSAENLRLIAIEYFIRKDAKGHSSLLRRQGLGGKDQLIFEVPDVRTDVFTAYVLDLPKDKNDPFPRFHAFDAQTHPSGDLPRITLIRIHLSLKGTTETVDLVSKVFLPVAHANVLQGDWNVE